MTGSGPFLCKDEKESRELMEVALGKRQADLVVINARVVNVYSGEILDGYNIGIKGKYIATVGESADKIITEDTVVIDAEGRTVIPGLIDGHTHLAWLFSVSEFLKYAMKGGTTSFVTETMESFPVAGYEGVADFLASLEDQPVKIFATAPAMVSISSTARGIPIETLRKLLLRDDIVGLGESYWQAVMQEPEGMLPLFSETLGLGKKLEGHAAGARGDKLAAYAAAGVSSCHEAIRPEEILERLRLGYHAMIREGSIRRDLETIAEIKDRGVDLRRLVLVTDGVEPEEIVEKGCMEFVVQKAIDCGFDPIAAVQMATLNVAEHFRLDDVIGGIAPGRYADLVIIPDLTTIRADYVISNGRIISMDGKLLVAPREHGFSSRSMNSISMPKRLEPADFAIRPGVASPEVKARVIDQVTDLVTKETHMVMPVEEGGIRSDISRDIIKVAAVDRTNYPGRIFTGLIRGFGMKTGALACSAAWDTSDIIVVGAEDEDMAVAVNRVCELQGGAVVSLQGLVAAELPLPIFGIMSHMPMESIIEKMVRIKEKVLEAGVCFKDPLLTLVTLTAAAIPYLRICEEGLVNLRDGKTLGLFVGGE